MISFRPSSWKGEPSLSAMFVEACRYIEWVAWTMCGRSKKSSVWVTEGKQMGAEDCATKRTLLPARASVRRGHGAVAAAAAAARRNGVL
jgi:hypothetical protein